MSRKFSNRGSAAQASLAAGPIFIVSTALAALYLKSPQSIDVAVNPAFIAPALVMFVPAIAVGFILSIVPNLFGSSLLYFTGVAFPTARAPLVWVAAGGLLGTVIVWATSNFAEPAFTFGLIMTSACCAAICRHSAFWD
ncbi:MAG: hypothetical protein ACXW27_07105 [Allosphingosinicella sp.]